MELTRGAQAAGPRVGVLSRDGWAAAPSVEAAGLLYLRE